MNVSSASDTVVFYEAALINQYDILDCLGPIILIRRNGTGGTSRRDRNNKKWLAISEFGARIGS